MKKILFFSKSESFGGIEKVLVDYCNGLNKTKYKITVLNWYYCKQVKENLAPHIEYKFIFQKKELRGVGRLVRDLPAKITHKIFIRGKYDVEIAFQEGITHKIISGAKKTTKKICWFHINPNYYNFNLPFCKSENQVESMLYKYNKFLFVSKFMRKWYQNQYTLKPQKMNVIYNPIDKGMILNKVEKEKVNREEEVIFKIICVGRLSTEKRFHTVIRICTELRKKGYEHIRLVIVGDGPEMNNLKNLIKENKAEDYIRLEGFQSNPYKYIDNSSLLVCASDSIESFGLVVAEAMVLEVPVISVKCGGPEELLDNGRLGMIVESNEEALFEGIESLIKDHEKYNYYKTVNKDILNELEITKIIKQLENIIEEEIDE